MVCCSKDFFVHYSLRNIKKLFSLIRSICTGVIRMLYIDICTKNQKISEKILLRPFKKCPINQLGNPHQQRLGNILN